MTSVRIIALLLIAACLVLRPWYTASARSRLTDQPDFAAVDAYIEARMKEKRIPGLALAIVQGDQVVYLKGYGIADPSGRQVTPETPFFLASITKPMTALAVMQLVEQHKLELDAPVRRYITWFHVADEAASSQITIRHLLYHTSGLPERTGIEYAGVQDFRPDAIEQRVRDLQTVQLAHPVGAMYEYSNPNYQILGMLIQQVTGQSYEAYMQEHVFQPLEMTQTYTSKGEAQLNGVATGYRDWFGIPIPWDSPFERSGLPSGYVIASVEDMAHFLIPHLNQGRYGDAALVSPASMAELLRAAGRKPNSDEGYAMDWGHMTLDSAHLIVKGGDLADFKTQMILVPAARGAVVTLMNTNDSLGSTLGDLRIPFIPLGVTKILLGQDVPPAPTSSLPAIYRGIPALIVVLEILGIVGGLLALRRWRSKPARRPRGFWRVAWHVAAPFAVYLGLGLGFLLLVPKSLGIPLPFMRLMYPDFGYTIQVIGVIGIGWAVLWLILATFNLGRAQETAGLPAPA